MSISQLFQIPIFWIAIILMVCAGASEISMAQWASAYAESALNIPKSLGDIVGPCLFAVMMGISRSFYGKYGEKLDLIKFMIGSGVLCLVCYLLAALGPFPILNLAGCSLLKVRRLDPNAVCGLLYDAMLYQPWDYARQLGVQALHPHFSEPTFVTGEVEAAHRLGLSVNVWTVNEEADLRRMAEMNCDGIISNYPDVALRVLRETRG